MPRDLTWGTTPTVSPFPSLTPSLLPCYNALRKPSPPSVLVLWTSAPRDYSRNFLTMNRVFHWNELWKLQCLLSPYLYPKSVGGRLQHKSLAASMLPAHMDPTTFFPRVSAGPPSDCSLSMDKGRRLVSSAHDTTGFQVGALLCEPRPQLGLVNCGTII